MSSGCLNCRARVNSRLNETLVPLNAQLSHNALGKGPTGKRCIAALEPHVWTGSHCEARALRAAPEEFRVGTRDTTSARTLPPYCNIEASRLSISIWLRPGRDLRPWRASHTAIGLSAGRFAPWRVPNRCEVAAGFSSLICRGALWMASSPTALFHCIPGFARVCGN